MLKTGIKQVPSPFIDIYFKSIELHIDK